MAKPEPRTAWAVWTNTDLCEGRGMEYVKVFCELQSTARRLAKKNYVQGSDCRVTRENILYLDGMWYAPGPCVDPGTREDIQEEERIRAEQLAREAKRQALERARELGLTEDEIRALAG
jgi:hypothetical protein